MEDLKSHAEQATLPRIKQAPMAMNKACKQRISEITGGSGVKIGEAWRLVSYTAPLSAAPSPKSVAGQRVNKERSYLRPKSRWRCQLSVPKGCSFEDLKD